MGKAAKRSAQSFDERRIAACLKACRGIPTRELEKSVIVELVAACIHIDDPRIREILQRLPPLRPRLVELIAEVSASKAE